jgi:hypothetical protein
VRRRAGYARVGTLLQGKEMIQHRRGRGGMWILVAECLAVFSAAAWPEKGGVDPVGRRADMRAHRTRGPSVARCRYRVVGEVREEGRKKTARCGQARGLYTPPKQRRARARALPNAGPSVS